jgi:peptidoglycan/LPS O-acetylase OafA/YrhL
MTINNKTSGPHLSSRRSARLKAIGLIVLVLGLGSAGLVYWTRSPDLSDDLSMLGYNKAQTRQMGMLYGKSGLLIEEWSNDLKQPSTQAIIIASASILIALGCFYFARLLENGDGTH